MTPPKKFWLPPDGRALAFLEDERRRTENAERKRRENQAREKAMRHKEEVKATTQVLVKQPKPELLPPAADAVALPPLDAALATTLDPSGIERQLREAAEMLDLQLPEGRLDRWFGRIDHRIRVKTGRAELLAGYVAACTEILNQGRRATEEAGALQRANYQLVIDRIVALHRLTEEQYRLELVRRRVIREDAIEDAKARALIAQHDAEAEKARRSALPPAPPPPPPPAPEDPRVKNKARLQQEIERLKTEEAEEIKKITAGKSENEWSDEAREEVVRLQNMYEDAKEQKREELRRFL